MLDALQQKGLKFADRYGSLLVKHRLKKLPVSGLTDERLIFRFMPSRVDFCRPHAAQRLCSHFSLPLVPRHVKLEYSGIEHPT